MAVGQKLVTIASESKPNQMWLYIKNVLVCLLTCSLLFKANAQDTKPSARFPYSKIYAYALDADINPALSLLQDSTYELTREDRKFIVNFRKRFAGPEDESEYMAGRSSEIDSLLLIFQDYWRVSMLNPENHFEARLAQKVVPYLMEHYPEIRGMKVDRENLGTFLSGYIKGKGLYTMDKIDYQGSLIDLVVWKKQEEKTYDVPLNEENVKVRVVFMQDFISLGWNEYATLGAHYPGGWTEGDALYCVKKAYDLDSENFKVSFLAHETRHFLDRKEFPELSQADMEFRSKLTELSMARETVYDLLRFFIENADYEAKNGHPIANFWIMHELSKEIFDSGGPMEDMGKWKQIDCRKINKTASLLLEKNTKNLRAIGSDVQSYIGRP